MTLGVPVEVLQLVLKVARMPFGYMAIPVLGVRGVVGDVEPAIHGNAAPKQKPVDNKRVDMVELVTFLLFRGRKLCARREALQHFRHDSAAGLGERHHEQGCY